MSNGIANPVTLRCRIGPQAIQIVTGGCGERVKAPRADTRIVSNPFMIPGALTGSYCLFAITVRDVPEAFPRFLGDCGNRVKMSEIDTHIVSKLFMMSGALPESYCPSAITVRESPQAC